MAQETKIGFSLEWFFAGFLGGFTPQKTQGKNPLGFFRYLPGRLNPGSLPAAKSIGISSSTGVFSVLCQVLYFVVLLSSIIHGNVIVLGLLHVFLHSYRRCEILINESLVSVLPVAYLCHYGD